MTSTPTGKVLVNHHQSGDPQCDEQSEDDTAAGDDAGHPFKMDEKAVEDGHSNDDQKEGQHRFRHCLEVIFEHFS